MAAGLGFKDFVTGEVLTAADVDGYLMQGIWVFASAAARDAAVTSPQEGNACYLKDTNQVLTYSGSAWVAVGGGGGKVLQVVEGTSTTSTTNSTSTYADTTLTATITPSAASSKIAVFVNQNGCEKSAANSGTQIQLKLVRGATTLAEAYALYTGTALLLNGTVSLSKLDSPSTTSATTYKTQFNNPANVASVKVQADSGTSTIILMEIGA